MKRIFAVALFVLLTSNICFAAKSITTNFTTKKASGAKVVRECTKGKKKMDVKLTLARKGQKNLLLTSFTSPSDTCDLEVTWHPDGKFFTYGYSVKKAWDELRTDESTLVLFDVSKNQKIVLEQSYKGNSGWGPQIGNFVEDPLAEKLGHSKSYRFKPGRVLFGKKTLIYHIMTDTVDCECGITYLGKKIEVTLAGSKISSEDFMLHNFMVVDGKYYCDQF